MAAGFTLSVSGATSICIKIQGYSDASAAANEAGLLAAGLVIQRGAARRSPVRTGRNAASINTKLEGSGKDAAAVVATGTEYGPYLELGTVKMAARPYMRPAAREDAPQALAAYESTVKGMTSRGL